MLASPLLPFRAQAAFSSIIAYKLPRLNQQKHAMDYVYLDYAASAPMRPEALDAENL